MKRKVFGYAADGDARIYNLEDGEELPEGWLPDPYPGFSRHERDMVTDSSLDLDAIIQSEDRAALDRYAAANGIQLDRRKSFKNMLSEYRGAIR